MWFRTKQKEKEKRAQLESHFEFTAFNIFYVCVFLNALCHSQLAFTSQKDQEKTQIVRYRFLRDLTQLFKPYRQKLMVQMWISRTQRPF